MTTVIKTAPRAMGPPAKQTTITTVRQPITRAVPVTPIPVVEEDPGFLYMCCSAFACLFCCPIGMLAMFCCWRTYDSSTRGDYYNANSSARWTIIISVIAIALGMLALILGLSLGLTLGKDHHEDCWGPNGWYDC